MHFILSRQVLSVSNFHDSIAGRLLRRVHWFEDSLLALMLLTMILLAVAQIFLRNIFDTGIVWGDPLIRVMVIWVALAGAMVAGRNNSHISIDIISPWVNFKTLKLLRSASTLFTAIVCGIMVYHSIDFILLEVEDGSMAFASIPIWVCELIIPIAFTVLTLRFIICFVLILTSSATSSDVSKE
ncbi:MAG: TRAP transporter small permease [Gammaproteobacteria bacterium]|nr:TRAP transporter small permease [Gammaproteobacteria bacterium]